MTRRTESQWRALFDAQAASGKTAVAFCRERGINAKYFSLRRGQLQARTEATGSSFVPVSVVTAAGSKRMRLTTSSGTTLEIPLGVDADWLGQLLKSLRD